MPFWKGRKKIIKEEPKVLVCPNCLKPSIKSTKSISTIYGPQKYECLLCGYQGRVYVDITGDDKRENENLNWLKEEFPDDLIEIKSAQELACESLEKKWITNQKENNNILREWCPFCENVQVNCTICQCPPELCSSHATEGLIGKLNEIYDEDTKLCDVDPTIYQQIVEGFQKLCRSKN